MKPGQLSRWTGVCAGAYFAAAAVYVANFAVLFVFGDRNPGLAAAFLAFPAASVAMGIFVFVGKPWAPKWAVVVAAAFASIHLIGLFYLFWVDPASVPGLARSLQWQLALVFFLVWLAAFGFAARLAQLAARPPAAT